MVGSGILLGREEEVAAIDATLGELATGRGAVFTVTGEAGIGKTRLLEAAVTAGEARGARAAWGRCWESGGAPSFWPWTQVARALVREDPDWIAALPELRRLLPELAEPGTHDGDGSRFAFFDAVCRGVRHAADARSLIVVLDDLHAADDPSLLLTTFVAEQLADAPVLLLCAYREAEAQGRPELASLARRSQRLALAGLNPDALSGLVTQRRGTADPQLAAALHDATAGNPFFADEVLRVLPPAGSAGAQLPLPDSVRETILARAESLSAEALETLTTAAVIGRSFRLRTLEHVLGLEAPALTEHLEEGARARLLELDRETPGRYRLAHALVRETLYECLPETERQRLHAAVGHALLTAYPEETGRRVAELAHHFGKAAAVGEAERAIEFAIRAGGRALTMLAYEEAVLHYTRALSTLHLSPGDTRRGELLLSLGSAQMRAGDIDAAQDTFREAAEEARSAGNPVQLAHAALGIGVWGFGAGDVDPEVVDLAEEALQRLGEREPALRARLLARLASALQWGTETARRSESAAAALALAESLEDPDTTAFVYGHALSATWAPHTRDEREWRAVEMRDLAHRAGDRELEAHAQLILLPSIFERGDGAAARQEVGRLELLATTIHQPRVTWQLPAYRALTASIEGRWHDYEIAAAEVEAAGAEVPMASVVYYGQRFVTLANQGRADELAGVFAALAEAHPSVPVYRCALALAQLDGGDDAPSRAVLGVLAGDAFASIPVDHTWLTSLALLAEVAHRLGDAGSATELVRLLEPWAHHHVVTSSAQYYGPVARFLGAAAVTAGDPAGGLVHLAAAHTEATRMGALPNLVHIALAEAAAHAALGDTTAAIAAAGEAARRAETLELPALAERAGAYVAPGAGVPVAPRSEPLEPSIPTSKAVLRREGDVWTFAFEGRVVRLPDAKGLQHLAVLLANPDVEIHATDLAASGDLAAVGSAGVADAGLVVRAAGDDATGPRLDATAKAAYKARIEELREALEEAEAFNDPERAAGAREELEFLTHEMAGAVGLGGRDRKTGSTSERARVNVTRAIRTVIKRVAEHDARLGAELEATVRTGTFCAYVPDHRRTGSPVGWSVHPH